MRVVGGQMNFNKLHLRLDQREYDIIKAHFWLLMLKDKMVPTKWLKPTKKGTKVNFNRPQNQKEWDDSYQELKDYIVAVNERYDTDLYIG